MWILFLLDFCENCPNPSNMKVYLIRINVGTSRAIKYTQMEHSVRRNHSITFRLASLFFFLLFQLRAIARNRTGIEDWILEKAKYRREGTDKVFLFPYDLGVRENIAQVVNWNCAPIGDGINWKVRDGCDQYTLTVSVGAAMGCQQSTRLRKMQQVWNVFDLQIEQIAQKAEKRARARTYTITRRATGSWIPLWSQGFAVCLNPPCTDESRIRLEVGDVVRVTRWKKWDFYTYT